MHQTECWEAATWDVKLSRYTMQLGRLNPHAAPPQRDSELLPEAIHNLPTSCGSFHWYEGSPPPRLLLYQQHQQDALRHSWDGLIAGTDGSVDERAERMGAGYVLGVDPEPILILSTRVEGPLPSARAEAASLLQLLRNMLQQKGKHKYTYSVLCTSKPLHGLLNETVSFNTLRAVRKRSTVFVTDLLHHKEGATVSRIIRQSKQNTVYGSNV